MSDKEGPARTVFAMKAVDMAIVFNGTFQKETIEAGSVVYRLEMATPDGPSTGGGAQALQHISLIPGDSSGTIVIGSANRKNNKAELRSFEYMITQYARRYRGTLPPISRKRYMELIEKIEKFFADRNLRVVLRDQDADVDSSSATQPAVAKSTWIYFVVFVIAVLGIAALASRLLR